MTEPTIVTITPDKNPRLDELWIRDALDRGSASLQRVPARYADAVAMVTEVRDWVRDLVQIAVERTTAAGVASIDHGPSLLLLGPVGTGKTYEAYGAIRALCHSGARCNWAFATCADLYAALRPRHGVDSEAEFEKYARASLLVLDDLGAAKASEWVEEINYRLVNCRYEQEMPTLITSNLPPRDLSAGLGDRVASRLAEMTQRVVLQGPDRRRAA